jgi:hypothetical protein
VADPDPAHPGQLTNITPCNDGQTQPEAGAGACGSKGAFALPSPLQASATSPAGTAGPTATVSGVPATLLTYGGPVSNDPVAVTFAQHIGANDPLRTGSYAKTLTFTLSTTHP